VTEGKRTLVAIHALQNSPDGSRLLEILSSHTADAARLEEAVDLMRAAGSIDFAEEYARALILDAKGALDSALPRGRAKSLLLSMADFFVKRSS
jgi:geranylgeranyl diphosphate synthase type I